MTRANAMEVLARHQLGLLSPGERESLLMDWWRIDEDDPEYATLPTGLKERMKSLWEPAEPQMAIYDPLLMCALVREFRGVRNEYLELRLADLGYFAAVTGDPEQLVPCPCCRFRTLDRFGEYNVCPVCSWENDGVVAPSQWSDVNRSTLGEAQKAYTSTAGGHRCIAERDARLRYFRNGGDAG